MTQQSMPDLIVYEHAFLRTCIDAGTSGGKRTEKGKLWFPWGAFPAKDARSMVCEITSHFPVARNVYLLKNGLYSAKVSMRPSSFRVSLSAGEPCLSFCERKRLAAFKINALKLALRKWADSEHRHTQDIYIHTYGNMTLSGTAKLALEHMGGI